ncbi:PREDICTED: uncharacterized protein LOC104598454 [Nelumbo nucifera]|uniref:Uncharacterized protein LOC104598454 n=1 Tax=Nelumbo nucifera TaxID=4432 RepID=A0A1U7ZWH6_NELNU|nr:PREDICTED: uncharacterized protein LOC104598454 [Nelumbo nucifera]
MNVLSFHRSRWKKKTSNRPLFFSISLMIIFFILLLISYTEVPKSFLFNSRKALNAGFTPCSGRNTGERFLWFAPHSGFSNQLSELKNAILMAAILNRTLIVPPVLDHHSVVLGSCPKFRVSSPNDLRMSVWNHVIDLLQSHRYISMADIVDLSSLVSSSMVKTIDFRVFLSLWCGVDRDLSCFDVLEMGSLFERLKQCGSVLSGLNGNINSCLYALDEDCRTTVWTYLQRDDDGILDSFQADEQLRKRKKISYIRKRRDVYKALGPGSKAETATVLAFGSLFTAPYKGSELYIDIHEAPKDHRIHSLLQRIEFLPFVSEILTAGKEFSVQKIKVPFLCAQLRMLDGQFKNHWKATFLGLKEKIVSLQKKGPLPIHIFVMTDLPESNWTGTYLGELAKDSAFYKLYNLGEDDELVVRTTEKLVVKTHKHCHHRILPDILLYVEETICSCASLGFVGTAGSTIAESIQIMRKNGICFNLDEPEV